MRYQPRHGHRVAAALSSSILATALLAGGPGASLAQAADDPNTVALDKDAILAANQLDKPQWYKDNIPFLDTPDNDIDEVYSYRLSSTG